MQVVLLDDDKDTLSRRSLRKCWTAARGCYSTKSFAELWEESNKLSDEKMLKVVQDQVIESGHLSVLRHVNLSFSLEGMSRTASHQLVRHVTGIAYEQQSQRYVKYDDIKFIIPPSIEKNKTASEDYQAALEGDLLQDYPRGAVDWYHKLLEEDEIPGEDARFVLPNATPTNIIMTANLNALINVCHERLCSLAQWEIRRLMAMVRRETVKSIPWMGEHLTIKCILAGYCTESRNKDGHCRIRPHISKIDIVKKKE